MRLNGVVWGTGYSIVCNPASLPGDTIWAAVAGAFERVDNAANLFKSDSEVRRLNRNGKLENPSATLSELISRSDTFYALTHGAFNPTVAPLVNLWGFGPAEWENVTDEAVDSCLRLVGMDKVEMVADEVRFTQPGVQLDFGAIAKGYGVDCVVEALGRLGVRDCLTEIGGEVRVTGLNPRGEWWAVQIDAPVPDSTGLHRCLEVVRLHNCAIATSGNYRNYRIDADGNVVHHTISPVTGRPVVTDLLSASVFADNCMTADALATACIVLGKDKATELLEQLSSDETTGVYGAVFVTQRPDKTDFETTRLSLDAAHVQMTKKSERQ